MAHIEYRRLGASGLTVSTVGLGCNNFGRAGTASATLEGTSAVIDAAIEAGVTLFDTADMYGAEPGLSETMIGESLKGRRENVVLATKFGMTMNGANGPDWDARGSRRYIRLAVESSLKRLQTEWIDLYQLHAPDPATPVEETLSTLDDLISEGKIRYIGHSNFGGWRIAEAEFVAQLNEHPKFISAQNEYSLLARDAEKEVLPAVEAYGLGFLPFRPLYNGFFTGKFSRSGGPSDSRIMRTRKEILDNAPWEKVDEYQAFCDERGVSMLEATFGWLLSRSSVSSVIAGATRPVQVAQNADAASAWKPSAEEAAHISEIFA